MKVLEVDRIMKDSVTINSEDDLDKIIELPLLESCKIFYNLGIKTVMSGCNKYDVLNNNRPRRKNISFADNINRDWSFSNGYGWILLDFKSMSFENQEYLLSLCDENNFSLIEKLPENAKMAFFDLCKLNDVNPSNKELIECVTIPQIHGGLGNIQKQLLDLTEKMDNTNPRPDDPIYVEFYRKKHTLFITPYIQCGVLLKYPLNNETTVEEVSYYFSEFANTFSNQKSSINGFNVIK